MRPLQGGFQGWRSLGYPLQQRTPESVESLKGEFLAGEAMPDETVRPDSVANVPSGDTNGPSGDANSPSGVEEAPGGDAGSPASAAETSMLAETEPSPTEEPAAAPQVGGFECACALGLEGQPDEPDPSRKPA